MKEIKMFNDERENYIKRVNEALDAFKKRRDEVRVEVSEGLISLFGRSTTLKDVLHRDILVHNEDGNIEFVISGSGEWNKIYIRQQKNQISEGDISCKLDCDNPQLYAFVRGTNPEPITIGYVTKYEDAVALAGTLHKVIDALNTGYELFRTVMLRSEEVLYNLAECINSEREVVAKKTATLENLMDLLNRGNNGGKGDDNKMTVKVNKLIEGNTLHLTIEIGGNENENYDR